MAQRRMFSPQIVGSDAFLDMPISSQALYFHLGMYVLIVVILICLLAIPFYEGD
jgi:hypothetical protein